MIGLWLIIGVTLVGLIIYWQLILAEGTYLGQGVVTLLYDWTAHKYNDIKDFDIQDEQKFLGQPLSRAVGENFAGIILDVATGTGRVPTVMRHLADFKGQVIGLDHSKKMLAIAKENNPGSPLLVADAMRLPFASNAVFLITCLEALEFLPQPGQGLTELVRVLKPGGILLTTRRRGWETVLMPGKTWTAQQIRQILQTLSLIDIMIIPWQVIYDQVWARKRL